MSVETAKEVFGIEVGPMDRVTIGVAAPDVIRSWSRGEVKNPETIFVHHLDELSSIELVSQIIKYIIDLLSALSREVGIV